MKPSFFSLNSPSFPQIFPWILMSSGNPTGHGCQSHGQLLVRAFEAETCSELFREKKNSSDWSVILLVDNCCFFIKCLCLFSIFGYLQSVWFCHVFYLVISCNHVSDWPNKWRCVNLCEIRVGSTGRAGSKGTKWQDAGVIWESPSVNTSK